MQDKSQCRRATSRLEAYRVHSCKRRGKPASASGTALLAGHTSIFWHRLAGAAVRWLPSSRPVQLCVSCRRCQGSDAPSCRRDARPIGRAGSAAGAGGRAAKPALLLPSTTCAGGAIPLVFVQGSASPSKHWLLTNALAALPCVARRSCFHAQRCRTAALTAHPGRSGVQ